MALRDDIDPNGLLEYSVVYTDRSLNHMSKAFQQVMNDISTDLKEVYEAHAVAVVPGGGTYAMEAVARQLADDKDVLIIRNGWFSYRWTQILEKGKIAKSIEVMKAEHAVGEFQAQFSPVAVADAVAKIKETKPQIVFMPHVETSAGMILPDDYIKAIAAAVHEVGGLLVLDSIASGAIWVEMQDKGVDVLISAPQKGWSAPPCAGLVMLSEAATKAVDASESSSFSADLQKWLNIMRAYENGGHAYHATMPTDALRQFRDAVKHAKQAGFAKLEAAQWELGNGIRALLAEKGFKSVAAEGFAAPGVVVCYTEDDSIHKGAAFAAHGMQIAAGVPLACGEGDDFKTFRLGLFGIDKLEDVPAAIARFKETLEKVLN